MVLGFMHKDYKKGYNAYTLAEMLIVLVIISVVLISLPPATKKMFSTKEIKHYHGRFECYWNENGDLAYYYSQERPGRSPETRSGTIVGDDNDKKCVFSPPATYPYIMIHAVGGGGAGGNIITEATH